MQLQWHLMNVRASQIASNLTVCSTSCSLKICTTGCVTGIHQWQVDSPHKGPVMQKASWHHMGCTYMHHKALENSKHFFFQTDLNKNCPPKWTTFVLHRYIPSIFGAVLIFSAVTFSQPLPPLREKSPYQPPLKVTARPLLVTENSRSFEKYRWFSFAITCHSKSS